MQSDEKRTRPDFPVDARHGLVTLESIGMSTHLYLAGMAMQGMLSNMEFLKANAITARENYKDPDAFLAFTACSLADELIKQEEETR